ncbi:hypothetical protein BD779DRAFT_639968 [Infundibulicybe gibba]|nr:hypothetical protein BD779DRAFT_639968 [Infundibulicybe gibba]
MQSKFIAPRTSKPYICGSNVPQNLRTKSGSYTVPPPQTAARVTPRSTTAWSNFETSRFSTCPSPILKPRHRTSLQPYEFFWFTRDILFIVVLAMIRLEH